MIDLPPPSSPASERAILAAVMLEPASSECQLRLDPSLRCCGNGSSCGTVAAHYFLARVPDLPD